MSHPAALMTSRRFWPLFWAQFLGAFNDNFLKNALVILVAYQGLSVWGMSADAMATFAPALFILPYFLFSAMAGQLADKLPKAWLIQRVKFVEVLLMILAAAGFLLSQASILLVVLFFLGVQATYFGPLKYSVLPQLMSDEELVTGNALVEMGTNLAILLGTITGGLLIAMSGQGPLFCAVGLISCSVLGWLASLKMTPTPAQAPDLVISWNPLTTTWEICRQIAATRPIFNAILGISWFWLFGFALLALFIPYAKNVLHAGENVVTLFLAVFSVGVGIGSLLCEKLSFNRLELGLVPFGSIGMTLFAADLCFAWQPTPGAGAGAPEALLSVNQFLAHPGGWRIIADLALLSIFSGFFIVPLYTFIQTRAEPSFRSRVVAGNNVINALFIVIWAGVQILLLQWLPVTTIFLVLAGLNAAVALYIYSVIPEFFLRFLAYIVTHLMYRVKVTGLENIPREGAAVVVCNHVSFVDWLLLAATIKRPARFVMYQGFAKIPLLGTIFRQAKVIPIASSKEDPDALSHALDRIADELEAGEIVCIFPEGKLTGDGTVGTFRTGIERIVARTPVPVVPIALQGLWGSFFSRKDGPAMSHPFRRQWSRVGLVVGAPVPPEAVTADGLQASVTMLRGDRP